MSPIALERITVLPDRVEALVVCSSSARRVDTREAAASRLLALLPGLAGHRCSSEHDRTFADELASTSLAHVFEHVTLEVMALAGSPRTLRGETRRERPGRYRVTIADDDDAVCIGSMRLAARIIGHALGAGPVPDVGPEVASLAAVRAGAGEVIAD